MPRELFDAGRTPERPPGLDLAGHLRKVCDDVVSRLPQLGHIDMPRVAISVSQTRKPGPYGIHASLTPMRFEGGALAGKRRGRYYVSQRVANQQGQDVLYILTFAVPRFLDTDLVEKLTTIVHELWHISEQFDGDIRRHEGRCYAHTGSQKKFDHAMERMARQYLATEPDESVVGFLRYRFRELQQMHGRLFAVRYARPKLIPISANDAHKMNRRMRS